MIKQLKKIIGPFRKYVYAIRGRKPWSYGYLDSRWELIYESIRNMSILEQFRANTIPQQFGIGFDERVVEYPWIFSKLHGINEQKILDAGSTFNYPEIITHKIFPSNNISIFTFYPEDNNFLANRISYQFGDLRELPYKDNYFDRIICQSTIEHVDMDNSIYGYDLQKRDDKAPKSYEYLKVIDELIRTLKPQGKLLLTFPYGKFDNYNFFQQFDQEMVSRITSVFSKFGKYNDEYIHYYANGWKFVLPSNCESTVSYNPHTGVGKGNDGAAHCRSICCIEFIKN
jgi:SAM-dependent methyltransferase